MENKWLVNIILYFLKKNILNKVISVIIIA